MRGGEKVLAALGELVGEADIFTHAYLPKAVPEFSRYKVRESFIASLPFGRHHPQIYLPLMPSASRRLDLRDYELIISSESGPIKGIRKSSKARHVCYCHSPMRYVWDLYDEYYAEASPIGKLAMKLFTPSLRKADLESADAVDVFVANSHFVADRIRRIYSRDAVVVYPPCEIEFFSEKPYEKKNHYLFAGANVKYKRKDLAIAACKRMNRELRIVGGGGFSREDMRREYAQAKALLFPGIEDFGIVPVEAQAAGTPVIAFAKGGALETVVGGQTGEFFEEPTVESLCNAIEEFESKTYNPATLRRNAARFSTDAFRVGMKALI